MFTELTLNNQALQIGENDIHLIRYKYGVDFDEEVTLFTSCSFSKLTHKLFDLYMFLETFSSAHCNEAAYDRQSDRYTGFGHRN